MKPIIYTRLLLFFILQFLALGLAAQQQETEDNGSFALADTIFIINGTGSLQASIFPLRDEDYFVFYVPVDGTVVNVSATFVPSNIALSLELYRSNQTRIGPFHSGGAGVAVNFREIVCSAGYYYIRVRDQTPYDENQMQYTLTITLDTTDVYECNNSLAAAAAIPLDTEIRASINPVDDEDFYKFYIPGPGVIEVEVNQVPNNIAIFARLYQPDESPLSFRQGGSGEALFYRYLACQADTFYLEIADVGPNDANVDQYSLTISLYTEDEYECNNALNSSAPVLECDTIMASIYPGNDVDVFQFFADPGTYTIGLSEVPQGLFLRMTVMDFFGGTLMGGSVISGPGQPVSNSITINTAGTYYIEIETNGGSDFSPDLYTLITPFGLNPCSPTTCDIQLEVTALTPPSCDQADGSITLSALNGVPPYAYQIDGPVADAAMSNGGAIFNGLLAGNYTAMVTDGAGCTAEASFDLINDDAPQADFIFATNFLTATFQNNSAGVVDSVLWDFGDGELSNEYSPVHTFAQPGTYTVALAVFGPCGENITALLVSVGNVNVDPPVAAFTASPLQGCAPLAVTFDNASQNAGSYIWIFEGGIPSFSLDAMPPAVAFNAPGSHPVYLIAINTAGERDTASLTVEVQEAPTAAFSVQVDNNFVAFGNQSANADAYEWHFGDGATSSLAGPTHTYSSPGNYTVLLIASNGCADTASQTIQIGTPPSGNIVIDLGEAEGLAGEAVLVPVIVREVFDTLTSLQGTVEFLTPGVGRIVGDSSMVSGILAVNYNTGSFSLLFGQGLLAGAADTLFYLRVELIGNPGDMSELILTGNQAPIEITVVENGALASPDYVTETGKITILENANIDGNITFWSTGGPVRDVRVSLDIAQTPADPDAMQVTASDGRYHFDNIPAGSNVTISCLKDINLLNGVTTGPLYYVQEYIVNGNSPNINSPYQLIAADANCDDAVTTGDLALIQRVIVGLTPDFSPCNSWAFARADANLSMNNALPYPALYNLPSLASDVAVDFVGVKVGDILGAASPQNRSNGPLDFRTLHKLSFEADDRPVQAGEAVELQLRSGNFHHIGSLQFALQYAPHQLEFLGFGAEEGALLPIYNAVQEEGLIRLSWLDRSAQGLSFPAEQAALRLRFRATAPLSSLREALRIAPSVMKAEALNTAGEELEVQLGWQSVSDAKRQEQPAGYQLYQNIPNPARSKTSISFLLPRAEHASIQVIGPLGEVLAEYEGNFPVGRNEIEVNAERLPAGLYYYRLATSNYTATRSMLVR